MPDSERRTLMRTTAEYAKGRLQLAIQVTDNSAARILHNIEVAKEDGADIAVIAPPYFLLNDTPKNILNLYTQAIRQSPLPVGIYDRGSLSSVPIPESVIKAIFAEKNVIMVKDSSMDPQRRQVSLTARQKRPNLRLFNGWEFHCIDYLKAGYDGLLLGSGIFNGYLANKIIEAVEAGDLSLAEQLQRRMNRIMYAVYGGKKLGCFLSGGKELLVKMGIFSTRKNFLDYPLTKACSKAIDRVLEKDIDILLP